MNDSPSSAGAWKSERSLVEVLGPGMNPERLAEAIGRSGYPLQTVVAGALSNRDFRVEEEWAYEDAESQKRRAIDVLGELSAGEFVATDKAKTTVLLALLSECKQSTHPYLAFEAVSPPGLDRHPPIVGLGRQEIDLHPDDSSVNWYSPTPLARVLSMEETALVREPPAVTTVSRAVPKGQRFEISGDEPHNALIRPLIKAAHSYLTYWKKSFDQRHLNRVGRLAFPVAVVEAPLLLVRGGPGSTELIPADWVRVISHRAVSGTRDPWNSKGFDVVEVVHASFLEGFLDEFALPYLRAYYDRLGSIHEILTSGKATVPGWSEGSLPDNLITKVAPRSAT